ncbi:MAG: serine/threonine protein kinase [Planctomycetes bacterium]|nr:serine/threonine protein kinase [Planctomycetota bacterium]
MPPQSDPQSPAAPGARPAPPPKRSEGQALGKYLIQRKIGAGGMGTVFLAVDTDLKRTVALKVLSRDRARNPTLVKRFRAEGQAAANLRHDNLVTVYEAGEIEGYLYIALEYVEGTDVHNLVEHRGPVPTRRSVEIVKQVARALDHAWQRNIVHRDIKPSNLLIQGDGSVKLTDFGLARSLDETTEAGITRDGTTVGTVDYMAPEQARDSKAADIRSDIYSLGCTWYQMLTGQPPYEGSITNKLNAHALLPPPDPRDVNREVPEGVVAILHRMMAKNPDDRYQSPRDLLDDLESAILSRDSISNNVLAALAEEEDDGPAASAKARVRSDDDPAAFGKTARRRKKKPAPREGDSRSVGSDEVETPATTRKRVPLELPPTRAPGAKKQSAAAPVEQRGDRDVVKYLILLAAAVAFFALVWWISQQFGSAVDSPGGGANPFAASNSDAVRYGELDAGQTAGGKQQAAAAGQAQSGAAGAPAGSDEGPTQVAAVDAGNSTANPADVEGYSTPPGPPLGRGGTEVTGPPPKEARLVGRRGESFPKWAVELADAAHPIADAERPEAVFTVGRRDDGPPAMFRDLNRALARLPESGGTVRLVGSGPFFVSPVNLTGRRLVRLEAADGERPLVVLAPGGSGEAVISVVDGLLAIDGIDFIAHAQAMASARPLRLFSIGGDLVVQNSTATVRGGGPQRGVVFQLAESPGEAPRHRAILDRVWVRSEQCATLAVEAAAADVLSNSSLLVAGSVPAVIVGPPSAEASATATARRSLTVFSSTVVSRRAAIELRHGESAQPPATALDSINSVFAALPGGDESAMLMLSGWPTTNPQPKPAGVNWKNQSSLLAGWTDLIKSQDARLPMGSSDRWAQMWMTVVPPQTFHPQPWPPATGPAPVNGGRGDTIGEEPLARYSVGTLPANVIAAVDGGRPGALIEELAAPSPALLVRAEALAGRPHPPAELPAALGARTVDVDLDSEDLGEVVSSGRWDNGTRFRVTGSGTRASSPIELRGKSLVIEFASPESDPLIVVPKPDEFAPEAFISLENARLSIENGRFLLSGEAGKEPPEWFLEAVDSDFRLQGCAVVRTGEPAGGFAHWRRRGSESVAAAGDRFEQYAVIDGSFMAGFETGIDAELRGCAAIVRESLLIAGRTLFEIDVTGEEAAIRAAVNLERSTLVAGDYVFDVEASPVAGVSPSPLTFYAAETIFAGAPAGTGGRGATLLRDTAQARRAFQIDWWGRSNAFADSLARYVQEGTAPPPAESQPISVWQTAWGEGHVLRPLAGDGAVQFEGAAENATPAQPAQYKLAAGAAAAGWSDDGGAVGAPLERLPAVN